MSEKCQRLNTLNLGGNAVWKAHITPVVKEHQQIQIPVGGHMAKK